MRVLSVSFKVTPQFAMENGGNIWRTVFFFKSMVIFDYRGYTWKLVGLLIYWLIECCWFGVFWVVLLTGKLDWRNRFGNLFCHVLSMDLGGCYIYIFQYSTVAQCLLLAETPSWLVSAGCLFDYNWKLH